MRRAGMILPAALALALPAKAEVLQSSADGFVTRTAADVSRSPMEVWAELIAPAHWWNKEHSWSGDSANLYIDAQAGGCFCELLPVPAGAPEGARRGSVEHMRVIHSDPGRVLRLSGALGPLQGEALTGTLTITIKPVPTGSHILWEYVVGGFMRFKPEQISPAVDGVLKDQLDRLAAKLGTSAAAPAVAGTPGPDSADSGAVVDAPGVPRGDTAAPAEMPPSAAPHRLHPRKRH